MSPGVEPTVHPVWTEDGVRLAAHRIALPGAPRVLLVAGTFSNHSYWLGTRGHGFAQALAQAGFEPWALDTRGHGASQKPAPGERWDFDHWAREDVPAAIRAMRGADDLDPPCFLVGHSAGGASILAAGVMSQWMGWNIGGHWIGDDGTDYSVGLATLDLPLLFLAGSGDRTFAPPAACRGLHDMIGSADRTFVTLGRETGFSVDYGHPGMLASRAARGEVWPVVLGWMRDRLPPRPSAGRP